MARVLLLEDDPDQLEFRKLLLENAGHQVQTALRASEAMAINADVIVMDLVPGCEELLARLPETTPVVILSGRETFSPGVAARSVCILRKPCLSKTLIEAIGRVWISPSK